MEAWQRKCVYLSVCVCVRGGGAEEEEVINRRWLCRYIRPGVHPGKGVDLHV